MLAPGAIRHRHAVARRDVGIRRVEINFAATARRQKRHRRGKISTRPDFLSNTYAPRQRFSPASTQLLARDQINRQMIFKNLDVRLLGNRIQQRAFDFVTRHILRVKNPALGMPAFAA